MENIRKIRVTVDKAGGYKLEAMEGFTGTSCIEGTKDIELMLGGTKIDDGKKPSYYDGDTPDNIFLNI